MRWNDGTSRFDVDVRGDIEFTDNLTDVATMSDGGYLKLRDWSGVIPHTIEIRSSGGAITRKFYVGGVERPFDDEARRWMAEKLPALVRRSGIGAAQRVRSIFSKKGPSGVLDEIRLLGGDYARMKYFTALVDTARLDSTSLLPVLQQIGELMTSDYEKSQVLQHVAAHVRLDRGAAQAYVRAIGGMRSDYERRRALTALMTTRPVVAGVGDIALGSVSDMRSDYERSEVLRAAVAAGAEQYDGVFAAAGRMTSSYEKRRVLTDVLTRGPVPSDVRRGFLSAAATIDSDYDCAEVLTEYVRAHGVASAARQPFFAALGTIGSDFDRRRVLTELARKGSTARDVQQSVFDFVGTMHSDYDRAEILLAFVNAHAVDAASRQAFVKAAERINSSHDQNRVLAALVRTEGAGKE
jgi:hypothetical protein